MGASFVGGSLVVPEQSFGVRHVDRVGMSFLLQSDVAVQDYCSGESSFQGMVQLVVAAEIVAAAVAVVEVDNVEPAAAVLPCV